MSEEPIQFVKEKEAEKKVSYFIKRLTRSNSIKDCF